MNRQGIVEAFVGRWGSWCGLRNRPTRSSVPIRVYVAKGPASSSITRLIAAGLRAGGLRTFAKTSTTSPRLLFPDGREYPVYRPGAVNQREQRRVIGVAQRERADVLVLEGLAEGLDTAAVAEIQVLAATHLVLSTDSRGDLKHDKQVALVASRLPSGGKLFAIGTAPADAALADVELVGTVSADVVSNNAVLTDAAALVTIDDEQIAAVSWDEMERFAHVEYREHVAMALRVCAELGVDRDTALRGMWDAAPDPGVATVFQTTRRDASAERRVTFINGFAVTDPARLCRSWEIAAGRYRHAQRLAIVNCRADRPDCWRRLADSLVKWTPADHYLVIGSASALFAQRLRTLGVEKHRVTCTQLESAERISDLAHRLCGDAALVLGVGSMSGATWSLVNYFRKRTDALLNAA